MIMMMIMIMMMRRRRSEVVSSQWICEVTEVCCATDELSYDRVVID